MRKHIIQLARQYGFSIFLTPVFGYDELTIKTRIKHARRYGKKPTTKMLVISNGFVKNICRVYRTWPELGEFFLRTALWHEYRHLYQDPTTFFDLNKGEDEANTFMIEKTGRPGIVASVWYYTLHRKSGLWYRLMYGETRPDSPKIRQLVMKAIQRIYGTLIPPSEHHKIAIDVLWLEQQFQLQGIK